MGWFGRTKGRGIRDLRGKVVVITGAANGIGRALAVGLAARGCRLALEDIDRIGLARFTDELAQSSAGGATTTHVADVSDQDRMAELADEVVAAHGAVHVLINNAGVAHEAAFPQTSLDDWERVIGVNLRGVVHGCHFFMPHLAKVERAHIVNVSSMLGIVGMAGQSAYCASKFAVRGLSEALWEELRPTTIGLTLVHPGAVATSINRHARGDDPELLQRIDQWYERHAIRPEEASRRIIAAIESGTPRLLIAPETAFADVVKRLMPVRGNRMIVDIAIRTLGVEDMRAKRLAQWRRTMIDGKPEAKR
jgi:NAD(P)-dependent dehydrogenase (short-subunit alcohol dehydrogenase family)